MNLDVELSSEITALNTPIEAWANVTDSAGNPQSGQTVEIRHEAEGFSASGVTAAMVAFGLQYKLVMKPIHLLLLSIGQAMVLSPQAMVCTELQQSLLMRILWA